jgi:hypothetical protein
LGGIRGRIGRILGVDEGWIAISTFDSDGGKSRDSNEGVFHCGFDRHMMMKLFEATGFVSVPNRTAAIMPKPGPLTA